jgi:hypothetical protein
MQVETFCSISVGLGISVKLIDLIIGNFRNLWPSSNIMKVKSRMMRCSKYISSMLQR